MTPVPLLLVFLAGFAFVSAALTAKSDEGGYPNIWVQVRPDLPSVTTVAHDFASFSAEVPTPLQYIVADPATGGIRWSYVHLMAFLRNVTNSANLSTTERTGPNLRVGGNSADETFFAANKSGVAPPAGDHYVVSNEDIAAFAYVAHWHGTLSVDLSLRNPTDTSNAVAYAQAVHAALSPDDVQNFEIGNEPELFTNNGIRSGSWNYSDWVEEWGLYARNVTAAVGDRSIQGAVFCCGQWDGHLVEYAQQYREYLSTVSHHFYPMSGASATIAKLLDPKAVNLSSFHDTATHLDALGVPYLMGEGNSAYDGGREGVSNAFAATLWSADVLFEAAAVGMRRWNFHGGTGGAYTPIAVNRSTGVAEARPLYYGMWAFSDATSNRAALLRANVEGAEEQNVKVWATRHALNETVRDALTIVALHKRPQELGGVTVRLTVDLAKFGASAVGGRTIHVRRLFPASGGVNATSGLAFGGLTFDNSPDGYPMGTPTHETYYVGANSTQFSLWVAPATVLLADVDLTN